MTQSPVGRGKQLIFMRRGVPNGDGDVTHQSSAMPAIPPDGASRVFLSCSLDTLEKRDYSFLPVSDRSGNKDRGNEREEEVTIMALLQWREAIDPFRERNCSSKRI